MKLEDLDLGDMTPEEVIQFVILYNLYGEGEEEERIWYNIKVLYLFLNNFKEITTWSIFINRIEDIIREYNSRLAETSNK